MKVLLIASFLMAVSTPAFSNAIHVTGLKARTLMAIGDATKSTEASMGGKSDMELNNVKCEKIVDDKNDIYVQRCSFTAFEDVKISSDAEENRQITEDFRSALREIVKNEVKASEVRKTIFVKQIKCHAAGLGHGLDRLDIEPNYICAIIK